jgi:hypothetical protein
MKMLRKQATSGKRSQIELQSRPFVINFKCGIFCEDPIQTVLPRSAAILYSEWFQEPTSF